MINKPLVSICCITYNHANYISDAIESFLMQKTDFPIEIIIHDDASTDGTTNIVREYEKKYPDIIKPICQTTNKWSEGKSISLTYVWPNAQGKYIALCEGDDYWTDSNKLQKQIDALIENTNCDMCIHPANVIYKNSEKIKWKYSNELKIFSIKEVLSQSGQFSPTASYVFKKSILDKIYDKFQQAPVMDFFLEVFGSLSGGLLYLPEPMSVYRKNVNGSWTDITLKNISSITVLEYYNQMSKYLLILKDELSEYLGVYVDRKIAAVLYGKALYFLANSDFEQFRTFILKSFNLYNDFSPLAKIIYLVRNFGRLARLIYVTKIKYYNV